MKYLFYITAFVLVTSSCRTVKTSAVYTATLKQADTLVRLETVRLDTLRVPVDTASISVPVGLLGDTGIGYLEKRNGRATVKLQRAGNMIYATAVCDSLEKIIASMQREIIHLRSQDTRQTATVKQVTTKPSFWLLAWCYGCTFLLLFILIKNFTPL